MRATRGFNQTKMLTEDKS